MHFIILGRMEIEVVLGEEEPGSLRFWRESGLVRPFPFRVVLVGWWRWVLVRLS